MSKTEWGNKHVCANCGAKFYDLKKDPAVCPTCGTQVSTKPLLKPRRTAVAKPSPKLEPTNENIDDSEFPEEIEDVEIEDSDVEMDDGGDDDLLVDDEMDEDVSEVAEHIEPVNEKE